MKKLPFVRACLVPVLGAFVMLKPVQPASAQGVPPVINYQGQFLDPAGKPLPNDDYEVQVTLFNAESGGTAVWGPQTFNGQSGTGLGPKVPVVDGRFNMTVGPQDTGGRDLGGVLSSNSTVFLEVKLGSDDPVSPRQQVLSAPFAFTAAHAVNAQNAVSAQKATMAQNAMKAQTADKATTADMATNAVNAVNAANAAKLAGFDWNACFDGGNPTTGFLNVADVSVRDNLSVAGGVNVEKFLTVKGVAFVIGTLFPGAISVTHMEGDLALNDHGLYLRNLGDFNHFLSWGNIRGNQSGFDGPVLVGRVGGVLGTAVNTGDWSLRWNANGSVQVRGSLNQGSDRAIKEHFTPIDAEEVLSKVVSLPITRWNYKDDPSAKHIGPVSQDFMAAFGLGSDDKFIAAVDADGVALVSIQALNKKLQEKDEVIQSLELRLEKIERMLQAGATAGQ